MMSDRFRQVCPQASGELLAYLCKTQQSDWTWLTFKICSISWSTETSCSFLFSNRSSRETLIDSLTSNMARVEDYVPQKLPFSKYKQPWDECLGDRSYEEPCWLSSILMAPNISKRTCCLESSWYMEACFCPTLNCYRQFSSPFVAHIWCPRLSS